ncbi:MAG: hypothetical protein ACE5G8_16525, partial [Anaerolineae bacterium]
MATITPIMSKRATTILLTLSTTVILVFGIWQTAFHWAWLERPYLLPGLLFLLPAALSVADIVRGIIQRTPANLFWSWLKHSFETYYILLVQIGVIPIAFLLFPAGFFLQIISLVGEGIRLFSEDLRLHADVVRMDERKPINLYADA